MNANRTPYRGPTRIGSARSLAAGFVALVVVLTVWAVVAQPMVLRPGNPASQLAVARVDAANAVVYTPILLALATAIAGLVAWRLTFERHRPWQNPRTRLISRGVLVGIAVAIMTPRVAPPLNVPFTRPILYADAPDYAVVTVPPAMAFELVAVAASFVAFAVVLLLLADVLRPAEPLKAAPVGAGSG